MNLNISINEEDIRKKAQEEAASLTKTAITDNLRANFAPGLKHQGQWVSYPGPMRELINKKIDELFLSDKYQQMIETLLDKHLEQAIEEACKKRIEHQANKAAFSEKK